jgi:hypothetical protein
LLLSVATRFCPLVTAIEEIVNPAMRLLLLLLLLLLLAAHKVPTAFVTVGSFVCSLAARVMHMRTLHLFQ